MSGFKRKYTGVPGQQTPAEIELAKLADEYVRRCDEFEAPYDHRVHWQPYSHEALIMARKNGGYRG